MKFRFIIIGILLWVIQQGVDAQTPGYHIEDLKWLTGNWSGEGFGGTAEEYWMPLRGNSMMATFRLAVEGSNNVYEILLIEESEAGVFYRFKHYSPGLKAWEDGPLVYKLTDADMNYALFEAVERIKGKPKQLIYSVENDILTTKVIGWDLDKEGKTSLVLAKCFQFLI